jgi:amidohydrolase
MPVQISDELKRKVDAAIAGVLPEVIAFRHERHMHPELTWQEEKTAVAVQDALKKIEHLQVKPGVGKYGVVATLTGAKPGPVVALRADMDALPVREDTGKPYCSRTPGVMHACGHDGHMANLLGAVRVLTSLREHVRGQIKFIFQPAEEGGAGADVMCNEGALKDPDVDVIFGLHGWPELKCGKVAVKYGPLLASTSDISIKLKGRGCHAAMPHLGTDQVLIGARIIEALQAVSSRLVSPTDPVAVSITTIHAGTAVNVIPATLEMGGTLRTMSNETRKKCQEHIIRIACAVAAAHGAEAEVSFHDNYPPTVNHAGPTRFLEELAQEILPADMSMRLEAPTMGGEDFAFFLERIPGSYFFLGVSDGRTGGYPSLHHPGYDFNDQALTSGMKMFVHAALSYADFHPAG